MMHVVYSYDASFGASGVDYGCVTGVEAVSCLDGVWNPESALIVDPIDPATTMTQELVYRGGRSDEGVKIYKEPIILGGPAKLSGKAISLVTASAGS
ncbi:hypothetical protein Tco_1030294 [Tanacetum coccineum]|uniref:Uncharacterized protein n=1 Tax=Tanacetum coccineum TaxID=301880 RepID=A0ABQ5G5T8_9ASTR